jgi:hypothetical protein
MNTDEYLSVFSTWILFDQKTVLGGGNGHLARLPQEGVEYKGKFGLILS